MVHNSIILQEIKCCIDCPELVAHRKNIVMAEGSCPADILFLTGAPHNLEDTQRRPLAGVGGKYFRATIRALNLERFRLAYLCSVMCYPYKREPTDTEIDNCRGKVVKQINIIQPRVIVAMGRVAHSCVLNIPQENVQLMDNCGTLIETDFQGKLRNRLPVILTLDPAYVLKHRTQMEGLYARHLNAASRLLFSYKI